MTLAVRGLRASFGAGARRFQAVDGVDLEIPRGTTVGLVGESGSGKSTLARALVGLGDVEGEVSFGGGRVDLRSRAEVAQLRRRVQLVFQDPLSSLNPRITVAQSVADALRTRPRLDGKARRQELHRLFELVTLRPELAERYPHQLSGGQRQRVAVARALAVEPEVLIADEITSALDVSVQARVLNMLRSLQTRLHIAVLFISHDLSVVRYMSDTVAVMYLGRIVEVGSAAELFAHPRHPYTRALLDSVPTVRASRRAAAPVRLGGEVGDPRRPPSGCRFHPRCPIGPAVDPDRTVCRESEPVLAQDDGRTSAACHFPLGDDLSSPRDRDRDQLNVR